MTNKKNNKFTKYLLTTLLLLLFIQFQGIKAQNVDIGADFVNRYVWRGIDFGNSASLQPHIEFTAGGFTLGTWASYAISPVSNEVTSAVGASEHDIYIGYNFGPIAIGVTDYYFPTASEFFNFENNGTGAHFIETNISFTGGELFPLSLYGAVNAYNDPDNSVYLEAGLPFMVGETKLGFTIGGVPAKTAYYGTTDAAIINMSLSVSRDAVISESFSLPLFASYILNPYAEKSYLIFGFSL